MSNSEEKKNTNSSKNSTNKVSSLLSFVIPLNDDTTISAHKLKKILDNTLEKLDTFEKKKISLTFLVDLNNIKGLNFKLVYQFKRIAENFEVSFLLRDLYKYDVSNEKQEQCFYCSFNNFNVHIFSVGTLITDIPNMLENILVANHPASNNDIIFLPYSFKEALMKSETFVKVMYELKIQKNIVVKFDETFIQNEFLNYIMLRKNNISLIDLTKYSFTTKKQEQRILEKLSFLNNCCLFVKKIARRHGHDCGNLLVICNLEILMKWFETLP